MKNGLLNSGFLLLMLGIIVPITAAQSRFCTLRLSVYEFKDDGTSEKFPISDSKIKLVKAQTNRTVKINSEISTVTDAVETDYKLIVSKNGFQNTAKDFSLDCGLANEQNEVSEIVFLWKGDEKQTVKISGADTGAEIDNKQLNFSAAEPVNGSAINLPRPEYPPAARAVKAAGTVSVQVLINELGNVISAKAVSGHPLLRSAAVKSAKSAKFSQTYLNKMPVKVSGIIVYNFVP